MDPLNTSRREHVCRYQERQFGRGVACSQCPRSARSGELSMSRTLRTPRRLLIVTLATAAFVSAIVGSVACGGGRPVDDCFGGALSADPLHCHVLKEAHNAGIIEVDGIYGVARGLFIFLTQDDRVGNDVLDHMRRTAQEEARRTGEYECVLDSYGCGSGVLPLHTGAGYILPESSVYQDIQLLPGGAEERRSYGGWQVFRELWPGGASGAVGYSSTTGDFDVSDVDVTNFPVLRGNCGRLMASNGTYDSCLLWEEITSLVSRK